MTYPRAARALAQLKRHASERKPLPLCGAVYMTRFSGVAICNVEAGHVGYHYGNAGNVRHMWADEPRSLPVDPEVIRDALLDPVNRELVSDILRREIRTDPSWFRALIAHETRAGNGWPLGRLTTRRFPNG